MKMNKLRYMYDAAVEARLRAKGLADLLADTPGTPLVLDLLTGYWTTGELADQTLAVVANVTALDKTTGDETYVLNVATNNNVIVGTATVKSTGQYVILLDMGTVKKADPTVTSLRLDIDVSGTTPIINFHSWIANIIGV